MKRIVSKGTGLEAAFARILRKAKLRYRRHPKGVYGNPDFEIADSGTMVFCDSAFWHGRHLAKKKQSYGKNRSLWLKKLEGNVARDKKVTRELKRQGYGVFRAWDEDILRAPETVAKRLLRRVGRKKRAT